MLLPFESPELEIIAMQRHLDHIRQQVQALSSLKVQDFELMVAIRNGRRKAQEIEQQIERYKTVIAKG